MRFLVIAMIAIAWLAGWLYGDHEDGGPPPGAPLAETFEDSGLLPERGVEAPAQPSRLVALWDGMRGAETLSEPLPDRLVNCDLGSTRTFMRESKCLVVGRVAEQRWTILD
jgi:hypothetical protein